MTGLGGVTVERGVAAPMRDGTLLRADVYRPAGGGPFPVLLQRTPYDKTLAQTGVYQHPAWYARHGFVVAVQDVRGRFASDGEFRPFHQEVADGADSIRWAAGLAGTTGRVGTYGFSYSGSNQLLAGRERPAGLATASLGMAGSDFFDGWTYRGGAFQQAFVVSWTLQALAVPDALRSDRREAAGRLHALGQDRAAMYRASPHALATSADLDASPYFREWIEHDTRDAYWRIASPADSYDEVAVPCLHIGGWYDVFLRGTLATHAALQERSGGDPDRRQALVIGPWQHGPWSQFNGSLDLGASAANGIDELQIAWFDHWLKGTPLPEWMPAVRYFLMGANHWCDAEAWPPPGLESVELHLRSDGRAPSLSGDGRLSRAAPGDEPPDIFVFDPGNPVPSLGGASCCQADSAPMGPFDQRGVEIRNDVLVYTSPAVEQPLDVIGPVELVLYAATDGPDTDWTAKLVDVAPDGRAINLCDGIVRARYRHSLERPELLEPGECYEYRISLGATANRFLAGHRIRVEVSSSNFPAYDVNPNTGRSARDAHPPRVATQVVFHDGVRPSRLRVTVRAAS